MPDADLTPAGESALEVDGFHQCPHEVIRATCVGACLCPCEPCRPSRAALHPETDQPDAEEASK